MYEWYSVRMCIECWMQDLYTESTELKAFTYYIEIEARKGGNRMGVVTKKCDKHKSGAA